MASAWRHLARSYEFIESLERFLLDGHAVKNALPVQRLNARSAIMICGYWELRRMAMRATFSLLNALIANILKLWAFPLNRLYWPLSEATGPF
jgi:hypothetical protein